MDPRVAGPPRLELLDEVLAHLAEGTAHEALTAALDVWNRHRDPAAAGLAAVAGFWCGDFVAATAHAVGGLAAADDDVEARALCLAAAALAAGGDPGADGQGPWTEAAVLLEGAPAASRWWSVVRYLLIESALVSARIDDARAVDAGGPAASDAWRGHPFAPVMVVCQVRVAAFSGQIGRAAELLPAALAAVVAGSRLGAVIDAVAGLVLGNADDATAYAERLPIADEVPQEPRDFVDRGTLLLLAFGAVALADIAVAAALTLRAGADEALSRCTIIDRALGLEMLLVAALDEGDSDAADAWLSALDTIAAHPVARPTVARARARVALANDRPAEAIDLLVGSVADCVAAGRQVEAAEGGIVLARARIAACDVGGASRDLRTLVAGSDRAGHAAVRRSAGATLASSGRRLPPVAGAGWSGLSVREAEVARAILAGLEFDEIAATLFVSPHTVRVHTSRVLCAFGVATRIGLLASVGETTGRTPGARPPLSPRQAEVAELVAAGRSNRQVADALGISVKGVEKHVGDILLRWSAGSRFELARTWWSGARPEQSAG